ncbi:hypothetical protein [Ferrimonas marina]|uniref:Uncharacterized protein n=1 Tax=Ferrimonas marina TaxID=299255 RepID=A0A1M5TEB0_9GAMM|nr:hypothetical protein [Ferrimonas marina]SHH49036.1 hypothetical protein SAMN02745129_2106 [Ferrimonas marina]
MSLIQGEICEAIGLVDTGTLSVRNREMTLAKLGLAGEMPATFQEISQRYGVTREGCRKAIKRTLDGLVAQRQGLVALHKANDELTKVVPLPFSRFEEWGKARGYLSDGFGVESMLACMQALLGDSHYYSLKIGGVDNVVTHETRHLQEMVLAYIKKRSRHNGAVSLHDIYQHDTLTDAFASRDHLRQVTSDLIHGYPDLRLVGTTDSWVYDAGSENRLVTRVLQIGTVFQKVPIGSLIDGLDRFWCRSVKDTEKDKGAGYSQRPPQSVIVGIIKQQPGVSVDGDQVSFDPDQITLRKEIDSFSLDALKAFSNGEVIREKELEERVTKGDPALHYRYSNFINFSPLIVKVSRGLYAPLGQFNQLQGGVQA